MPHSQKDALCSWQSEVLFGDQLGGRHDRACNTERNQLSGKEGERESAGP